MRLCLKTSLRLNTFFGPRKDAGCCAPGIWIASEFPAPRSPASMPQASLCVWEEDFMRFPKHREGLSIRH